MVKHAKSLQTGCADQTTCSTMLFSMMYFTAVYYTTISIFQHIGAECATVLHENKTEIRTEGRPTKTLFVCVCFLFYNYYFRERTFKRIVCFSFNVLFCLPRTPNAIDSMLL